MTVTHTAAVLTVFRRWHWGVITLWQGGKWVKAKHWGNSQLAEEFNILQLKKEEEVINVLFFSLATLRTPI